MATKAPPVVAPGDTQWEDAADKLSKIVSGNSQLVTRPDLVSALNNANATPQQAQAINHFVGGLQAGVMVENARQNGTKVQLSDQQRGYLGALGINYNDVLWTAQQQQQATAAANEQIQLSANEKSTTAAKKSSGSGWFSSIGSFGHHLTHNAVTDTVNDASNLVANRAATIGDAATQPLHDITSGDFGSVFGDSAKAAEQFSTGGNADALNSTVKSLSAGNFGDAAKTAIGGATGDEAKQMQDAGYDPSNPMSVIAWRSSGKAELNIDDLKKANPDTIDDAQAYALDPQGYIDNSIQGAATPEIAGQKLQQLNDPKFQQLVQQVLSRRATVGNVLTEGIDPVKHPVLHNAIAGTTDVAFSFLADPTLALAGGVKALKLSQIGIDSVGDGGKVAGVLIDGKGGIYGAQVRRGMQSLIDNTTAIREATTDAEKAAAYARIRTETPGLQHLVGDFTGATRGVRLSEGGEVAVEKAEPITTLAEAGDYLSSKVGMVRLMSGRASLEGRLMPGQLSAFGYRKFAGSMAANRATKSLAWTNKLAINLNDPGVAAKVLATAGDSVDVASGKTLQALAEQSVTDGTELASRVRGEAIKAARTGYSLGAQLNRWALIPQRMFSYLPKDTVFRTDDPNLSKQVFQYANMYLSRGDANLLAAKVAAADEGGRKAILKAMNLQTLHAAGMGATEGGQDLIRTAEQQLNTQRYASTQAGIDRGIDPDTNEEMAWALHLNQLNPSVTMTNFSQLQKYGAKIGLWENTLGRAFNAPVVDHMMGLIKIGWLTTGTNVARNTSEGLVSAMLRGDMMDTLRAKAVARNLDMLPDRTPIGKAAAKLTRTKAGNLIAAPFAFTGEMYRKALIGSAKQEDIRAMAHIANLDPNFAKQLADNWVKYHATGMVDPEGVDEASNIIQLGYRPAKMVLRNTGYQDTEIAHNLIGASRWSDAMSMVVNGHADHADLLLKHIEDPSNTTLTHIVDSLLSPKNYKATGTARRANIFRDENGAWQNAVTDDQKQVALHQWANDQAIDLHYLLQGRDGSVNQQIIDHVRETGEAPDAKWLLDNVGEDAMPGSVNAPMYEALPKEGGVTGLVGALTDLAGNGYRAFVERPISRMSSHPIFLSNYGKERTAAEDLRSHLTDNGFTDEAADKWLQEYSMDRAFTRTVSYIDHPGLRTQMDLTGRNFFAFSRATTSFIRRWGGQFVEDPGRLRKLMLAQEGAVHTGLVYTDANGDKQFVFPGSGAAINALQKVESLVPGLGFVRVPGAVPNLTGKVALLQPGLQNPLQYSMSPMVNIPYRAVEKLFPQHQMGLDEIDKLMNGQSGQGQGLLSEIEPTTLKKITDATNGDDQNSALASAMRSAILNMEAAGQIPDAALVDGSARTEFLANLRAQTKNALILRATLGFFAPAPPGLPTEDTAGSKADWFYKSIGAQSLSDEYKHLINDAGGDVATASRIWAVLHPDKMFYTTATTTNMTKSSVFSATAAAQSWLQDNISFMKKYSTVGAYFIPADTQQGDFSLDAYHAEMELGLRQHKTTAEYFTDVTNANANAEYFDMLDDRDKYMQETPEKASDIKAQFATAKAKFETTHPGWAESQQDYSQAVNNATQQLESLRNMVKAKNLPASVPVSDLNYMIASYDKYHAVLDANPGGSKEAVFIHSDVASQYSAAMEKAVHDNPALKGVYQGVFRMLDSKVLDPIGSS